MSRTHYRRWLTDTTLRQRFIYMYSHPEFFTIIDMARLLDISRSHVLRLRKMYDLPRRRKSPKYNHPFRPVTTSS